VLTARIPVSLSSNQMSTAICRHFP
jgi:hypothetical protein